MLSNHGRKDSRKGSFGAGKIGIFLTFTIALIFLLLLLPATSFAQGTGTISGALTESSGSPIQGISVVAYSYSYGWWDWVNKVTTDVSGSYSLDLSPGTYRLGFEDPNGKYIAEYFDSQSSVWSANSIILNEGDNKNINSTMDASGFISGTVTNASGTGLADIYVEFYNSNGNYLTSTCTSTTGSYALGGFRTGSYKIGFYDYLGRYYLSKYYNDKQDLIIADLVPVTEDQNTGGIDVVLDRGATISGKVSDANNVALESIHVSAYQFDPIWQEWCAYGHAYTSSTGSYTISGLDSGNYRIKFFDYSGNYLDECYDDKSDLESATPVTVVRGQDLTGISAQLAAAGKISGRVTDSYGSPVSHIQVSVFTKEGHLIKGNETRDDGTYSVGGLRTGSYRVGFYDWWDYEYVTEFFNNKANRAAADLVSVTAGYTTPDINAQLSDEPLEDTGGVLISEMWPEQGEKLGIWAWFDVSGYGEWRKVVYQYSTDGANWRYIGADTWPWTDYWDESYTYSCIDWDTAGLQSGTYYLKATAYDYFGNKECVTQTYILDRIAPQVPSNLTAKTSTGPDGGIDLSWSCSSTDDLHGFDILRSTNGLKFYSSGKLEGGYDWTTGHYLPPTAASDGLFHFLDKKVAPNVTYSYAIISNDDVGNKSERSNIASAKSKADLQAPTISEMTIKSGTRRIWSWMDDREISVFRITILAKGSDNAGWTRVVYECSNDGVTWLPVGEDVHPANNPDGQASSAINWDNPDVPEGTYQIRATVYDYSNNSASMTKSYVIELPPQAPKNLDAVSSDDRVTLQWEPSDVGSGADANDAIASYEIYRSPEPGGWDFGYDHVGTLKAADAMLNESGKWTFDDLTVSSDATYYYVVTAKDGSGQESDYSNEVTANTSPDTEVPTIWDFYSEGGSKIGVWAWFDVSGTDDVGWKKAVFEYSADGGKNWNLIGVDDYPWTDNWGEDWNYCDSWMHWSTEGLSEGTYQVRATVYDFRGNSVSSNVKNYFLDKTPPPAPQGLTANPVEGAVNLNWKASTAPDLDHYEIYNASEPGEELNWWGYCGSTESNLFTFNATSDAVRYYQVTAVDDVGNESAVSNEVAVKPLPDVTKPTVLDIKPFSWDWWGEDTGPGDKIGLYTSGLNARGKDNCAWKRVEFEYSADAGKTWELIDIDKWPYYEDWLDVPMWSSYVEWDVSNLPEGSYQVKVTAYDYWNNMASLFKQFTLDKTPPDVPQNLVATPVEGAIQLNWDASKAADVYGYWVYKTSVPVINGDWSVVSQDAIASYFFKTNSFTDLMVTPDATHYYAVSAVDDVENESTLSFTVSAVPLPDHTAPTVSLLVSEISNDKVGIWSWFEAQGSDNCTWHRVLFEYSSDNGVSWNYIGEESLPYNPNYNNPAQWTGWSEWDTSGLPEGQYLVRATAFDRWGNSGSKEQLFTLDKTPPSAARNLQADGAPVSGKLCIALTWDPPISDAQAFFIIYKNTEPGAGEFGWVTATNDATSPYNDFSVEPGKTYYYSIQAVDGAGNCSEHFSNEVSMAATAIAPRIDYFVIQGGAQFTTTVAVSLDIQASFNPTSMRFSNTTTSLSTAIWLPFSTSATYRLPAGDGTKTVYAQLKDASGGISETASDSIVLDTASKAPDPAKITLDQNALGSADTLYGAAGAMESGVAFKIYSNAAMTSLITEGTAESDGSFTEISLGDNLYGSIYIVAVDWAGNRSKPTVLNNDITAPELHVASPPDNPNPYSIAADKVQVVGWTEPGALLRINGVTQSLSVGGGIAKFDFAYPLTKTTTSFDFVAVDDSGNETTLPTRTVIKKSGLSAVSDPVFTGIKPTSADTVIFPNGDLSIEIPKGAFSNDFNLKIEETSAYSSSGVSGLKPFGGKFHLEGKKSDGTLIDNFNSDLTISFSYEHSDLTISYGGSLPSGMKIEDLEDKISVFYTSDDKSKDKGASGWNVVKSTVDKTKNKVTCRVRHFSTYTLMTDLTKPITTLVAPLSGKYLKGSITLRPTAWDIAGIKSLNLYVDGALKSTDIAYPYTFTLNTKLFANRGHALQLIALDGVGNSTSISRSVYFDNVKPRVRMTTKRLSLKSLGKSWPIKFALVDALNTKVKVIARVYRGTRLVKVILNGSPLKPASKLGKAVTLYWNGRIKGKKVAAGLYYVQLILTDQAGNKSVVKPKIYVVK